MWADFSDLDLIRLAYDYCLDDVLERDGNTLLNREVVERTLTEFEHDSCYA